MANFTAEFGPVFGIFDGAVWFPPGVINRNSHVLVSICEVSFEVPFKGAAVFTVHNVVPFDDGHVEITIDTGWTEKRSDDDLGLYVRMYFSVDPA